MRWLWAVAITALVLGGTGRGAFAGLRAGPVASLGTCANADPDRSLNSALVHRGQMSRIIGTATATMMISSGKPTRQ
jgi:hypothetical protein